MKALCMVAHPDDCVIFGYSYIYNHQHLDWTIGYLTYQPTDPRAREITDFWLRRHINCVFLGFEDHWHDNEQQQFTRWDPNDAMAACQHLVKHYDIVLTHGSQGEYGHIHHKLVHRAVNTHNCCVLFCDLGQGPVYSVPREAYSLDELPMHREVIQGFHRFQHRNSYRITK